MSLSQLDANKVREVEIRARDDVGSLLVVAVFKVDTQRPFSVELTTTPEPEPEPFDMTKPCRQLNRTFGIKGPLREGEWSVGGLSDTVVCRWDSVSESYVPIIA